MKTLRLLAMSCLGAAIFGMHMPVEAAEPIVWKFEQVSRIGQHETTILGAPHVARVDARPALCFNGLSDGVVLQTNPIAGWDRFTIEVLMKPDGSGGEEQRFLHIEDERAHRLLLETRLTPEREWALDTFLYNSKDEKHALFDRKLLHPADQWHWVALSFDGKTMAHYVDGQRELEAAFPFQPLTSGRMSLGVRLNERSWYKGCLAEVRFTPRALHAAELQTKQ